MSIRRISRSQPWQSQIELLEPRQLMTAAPSADFWIDESWSVDASLAVETQWLPADQVSGYAGVRDLYGLNGQGQTVAVIDTGIDFRHTALGGGLGSSYRVVGGWDFAGGHGANPFDRGPYGGHGTHVSGIIGARDATYAGVAPYVDFVGLRVFDDTGGGDFTYVENALRWVHQNRNAFRNPITTVNLSLGATWNSNSVPAWAMLEDEFAQLEADGIFIAVAAGNSFTKYNAAGLSYPAASSYVVPVASVDANGQLSYFSQRNSRVIAAPGRSITSTVPDYMGNGNGLEDDFAAMSGTSMAAPYVAGASIVLREALGIAGRAGVNQDLLYDVMFSTGDSVFDAATGQSYRRLNLARALDNLLPDDDINLVHSWGTLQSDKQAQGILVRTNDTDTFRFTAGTTGRVTLRLDPVTAGLSGRWSLEGSTATAQGNEFQFDVVAGQSYTVQLGTAGRIGRYSLQAEIEGGMVDWGTIDYREMLHEQFTHGTDWRSLTTMRDGWLSVQAQFAATTGNLSLELYDGQGNLLASGRQLADGARVDAYLSANQTVYLKIIGNHADANFRLANLVTQVGSTALVYGTNRDDQFEFFAGGSMRSVVNGMNYEFAPGSVTTVRLVGAGGQDTVRVVGTSGNEMARVSANTVSLVGTGFEVSASAVERIRLEGGGGNDRLELRGTAGDDTLTADPRSLRYAGAGFDHTAAGFGQVFAYGGGGNDRATLTGSSGNDLLSADPVNATLSGAGFSLATGGFGQVVVHSGGGQDEARFYDSAGNDRFVSSPTRAEMSGAGFLRQANYFRTVWAYSRAGQDQATLNDSSGNDVLTLRPGSAQMVAGNNTTNVQGFKTVRGVASSGNDLAYLYGSTGSDTLLARAQGTQMTGAGFSYYVTGFDTVRAFGNGGNDKAVLYRRGTLDTVSGTGAQRQIVGPGFAVYAQGFGTVQVIQQASPPASVVNATASSTGTTVGGAGSQLVGIDLSRRAGMGPVFRSQSMDSGTGLEAVALSEEIRADASRGVRWTRPSAPATSDATTSSDNTLPVRGVAVREDRTSAAAVNASHSVQLVSLYRRHAEVSTIDAAIGDESISLLAEEQALAAASSSNVVWQDADWHEEFFGDEPGA